MTRAGVHVAFLRGINVGGKHIVPMKDLAAMFAAAGCDDARTYIQSGNVVYRASAAVAQRVAAEVMDAIAARWGFEAPVVTRSAAEIAAIVRGNPFHTRGVDPKTLHVGFLLDRPSKARVAALDPDRSPPDAFVVRGSEVYLHLPNGTARSKLTSQYFDSTLATIITVRNWNTVRKLLEMVSAS
jgi:uncharacterized protein (DUF1697 family)